MKKVIFSTFLMCFAIMANAKIITGLFAPYYLIDETVFYDLNQDGKFDIKVSSKLLNRTGGGYYHCSCVNGVNGTMLETDGSNLAIGLLKGAVVGNNKWQDSSVMYRAVGTYYFPRNGYRYIGIRIQVSGKSYYGWMYSRVEESTLNNLHVQLYDWGYEAVAGESIKAGQTISTVPVDDAWSSQFTVTHTNNILEIESPNPTDYTIYNLQGQLLKSGTIQEGKNSIPFSNQSMAVFILSFQDKRNNRIGLKKLFAYND
jgi:hypothetical protein